jgi:hypothetical protein
MKAIEKEERKSERSQGFHQIGKVRGEILIIVG